MAFSRQGLIDQLTSEYGEQFTVGVAAGDVGNQGRGQGAAGFSRLEGASYTKGEIYFTSTQGGGAAETGPDSVGGYGNGTVCRGRRCMRQGAERWRRRSAVRRRRVC